MKKIVAAGGLALVLALGCGRVGEVLQTVAGMEVDMQTGAEASVPADYPLPIPEGGELRSSGTMSLQGVTMKVVGLRYPGSRDDLVGVYQSHLEGLGAEPQVDQLGIAGITKTRVVAQVGADLLAADVKDLHEETLVNLVWVPEAPPDWTLPE